MNEINSLKHAAEAVSLAFTESTCLQLSTVALLIAKRIGKAQPEATIKLGEDGFARLVHEVKVWVAKLPDTCIAMIHRAEIWPHRSWNPREATMHSVLAIHVPGTPTGAEPLTSAIYQVLCQLGEILTKHGFNTHDIGGLYDHQKLPHLGVLLRFPWSEEMKSLFSAYCEDVTLLQSMAANIPAPPVENAQERARMMWDAV